MHFPTKGLFHWIVLVQSSPGKGPLLCGTRCFVNFWWIALKRIPWMRSPLSSTYEQNTIEIRHSPGCWVSWSYILFLHSGGSVRINEAIYLCAARGIQAALQRTRVVQCSVVKSALHEAYRGLMQASVVVPNERLPQPSIYNPLEWNWTCSKWAWGLFGKL